MRNSRLLAALTTAALAVTILLVAAPAHADDPIVFHGAGTLGFLNASCTAAQVGPTQWELESEWTQARLTNFTSVTVPVGATITYNSTITHIATVSQTTTTTSGQTLTASASFKLFVSVSASVSSQYSKTVSGQNTTTDQSSESISTTFTPGKYGVYKGVLESDWTVKDVTCTRQSNGSYLWIGGYHDITVFTAPEIGAVSCADPVPSDPFNQSVNAVARKNLTNC